MSLIILVAVVVVVLAIAVYAIHTTPVIGEPWKSILIVLCCLAAIIVILTRSGLAATLV